MLLLLLLGKQPQISGCRVEIGIIRRRRGTVAAAGRVGKVRLRVYSWWWTISAESEQEKGTEKSA